MSITNAEPVASESRGKARGMSPAFCPHCLMSLGRFAMPYPVPASRCPHCRLLIGSGRARASTDGAEHGKRAHSAAAGMLAGAARREDGEIIDGELVTKAFERVADQLDCTLARLRMLDYHLAAEADDKLPCLADITATFGGWKKARGAAIAATTSTSCGGAPRA